MAGGHPLLRLVAGLALCTGMAACNLDGPGGGALKPLPEDAAFLFVSNAGVGGNRREIFAADATGSNVTRITRSSFHHHIIGISRDRRYIIATRSTVDVNGDGKLDDDDSEKKSIWLLDFKNLTETRLTSENDLAEGQSICPAGERIVFWMLRDGEQQSDIYTMRIDGTDLVNLTNTPGPAHNAYDPVWSSDGGRIAFSRFHSDTARVTLNVMNSDGSDEQMIFDPEDAVATQLFPAGAYDPAWSPDDRQITFVMAVGFTAPGENLQAGVWNVFTIPSDGTGTPSNLSEAGNHSNRAEYLPSFSPDGGSILYSSRYHDPGDPENAHIDIFVMDSGTGRITSRITSTGLASHDMFAVWLPPEL